jgi:predicted alpha/beta superfamily hydrolase
MIGYIERHTLMQGGVILPRDVLVWLPPGYGSPSGQRYPVLYMQDGQNIFEEGNSLSGLSWQADETAGRLMLEGRIRKAIIVALYNTEDRQEEYGDTEKGRAYMQFVVEKVKAVIDGTYRTVSGRSGTFVMGSSMGALISFLLAWNHPEVFSAAACLSPAFVYGGNSVIPLVRGYRGPRKEIRLYVDNGTVGLDRDLQKGCDEMMEALREKGFVLGRDVEWYLDEGAEHSEAAWSRRLWRPLSFLLGTNLVLPFPAGCI